MGQDLAPAGPTPHRPDYVLLGVVIAFLAFGLVMVLTSSMVIAYNNFGTQFYYLGRQGLWAVLGLVAMVIAWRLDFRRLGPLALWLLVGCIIALIAVLLFAESINGAQRWLVLGPFSFQPSELTKLGIILYMAYWLATKGEQVKSLAYQFVPFVIIIATIVMLLLKQPDLGSAFVIVATAVAIFFAAGMHLGQLLLFLTSGIVGLYAAITMSSYRMERFITFFDPWSDPSDSSYHISQVLKALGAGGVTGTGLGVGRGKFNYLPFPHTDSILAVIGEELGLIGTCGVLLAFGLFAYRGLQIAWDSPDTFSRLLATGITCNIVFQALVSIGVTTSSLPYTGLTLPFISFGGSSLLVTLASTGLLLNISRYTVSYEHYSLARGGVWRGQRGTPLSGAGGGDGPLPRST